MDLPVLWEPELSPTPTLRFSTSGTTTVLSITVERISTERVHVSATRHAGFSSGNCPDRVRWIDSWLNDEVAEGDLPPSAWIELRALLSATGFEQAPMLMLDESFTATVDGRRVQIEDTRATADGGGFLLELRDEQHYHAVFRGSQAEFGDAHSRVALCEKLLSLSPIPLSGSAEPYCL
jgi:hypothetical protein